MDYEFKKVNQTHYTYNEMDTVVLKDKESFLN